MNSYEKDIPRCRTCTKQIMNGEIGHFKYNWVTKKFDLFCITCYNAIISNLTSGANTV